MLRTTVLAAALLLAVTACGSEEAASPADAGAAVVTEGGPLPELTGDPTDTTVEAQVSAGGDVAPTELLTEDVVTGSGPVATLQDTVDVQYTGVLYSDGTTFDSSWEAGAPVTFPLSNVVPGFAQGIEGMAVGGRRIMAFPAELGYGAQANGPIPGGSALVFVVDLVGVS